MSSISKEEASSTLSSRSEKKYRMEVPIAGVPEEVEIDDIPST